mmetsp:Transcript_8394/g.20803  ORF Transcript_8394/g.20803 Transcript_8394/m.20803 type:complete len:242 (-) Transcript_8394:170-895(-)
MAQVKRELEDAALPPPKRYDPESNIVKEAHAARRSLLDLQRFCRETADRLQANIDAGMIPEEKQLQQFLRRKSEQLRERAHVCGPDVRKQTLEAFPFWDFKVSGPGEALEGAAGVAKLKAAFTKLDVQTMRRLAQTPPAMPPAGQLKSWCAVMNLTSFLKEGPRSSNFRFARLALKKVDGMFFEYFAPLFGTAGPEAQEWLISSLRMLPEDKLLAEGIDKNAVVQQLLQIAAHSVKKEEPA